MDKSKTVGFIGLGTMGAPMAWNIHKAGYELTVFNRSKDKTEPFSKQNITVRESPREIAEQSDIIITMVTDDDALIDVMLGYQGVLSGLKENAVVINMSTVSRSATQEIADAVKLEDGQFIEAPVSGTKKPAEDGTLTVLAGGDASLIDELEPLFKTMGNNIIHCGEIGQGTDMKLTINLLLGGMMQVFSETLVFGKKLGLDVHKILKNIKSGPLSSPLFNIKGQLILKNNFEKNFPVDLLLKDLNLVLDAAQKNDVYLPVISATREAVNGSKALGHGDEDMAAVIKLLEKVTGTEVRD